MKAIGLFIVLVALAAVTSAVEIHCEYRIRNWTDDIGDLYSCDVIETSVEDLSTVTDISGTHLEGRNNSDVKGFWFQGHEIFATIPTGVENFFGNLEAIYWSYGNITSIDSSDFQPFPNLLFISVAYNKLVTLDSDLFQHTPKLRRLYLDVNLLEHVGHGLLTGLPDLWYANFVTNPCIDIRANTTEQMLELKTKLRIQCPPLATSPDPPTTTISTTAEPNECPISCTSNEETQQMREMIIDLQRRMTEMESNPCMCDNK